jgi:phage recombination protein Bet
MTEPTETTARPADAAVPKPTEFTDAEQQLLDAMNVPTNRLGRGLLFREMQRTGLDPFAKHLYLREDWNNKAERNVYAVASTIDGFRIVAARQSTYEGQTAPQWCDKNGNWTDAWWAADAPVAARIGVYVRGYREPMWGIARFSEYKPSGSAGFMWGKMAAHMIAKVAEALAIRKAYPDQLSGVYTDDEMQQADARKDEQTDGGQRRKSRADDEWNTATGEPLAPPAPGMPTVTGEQLGEIARLLQVKRGATNGNRNFIIGQLVRRTVENVQTLSQSEARGIIETLTAESDLTPTGPSAVGTPDNPGVTDPQMKMIQAIFSEKGITGAQEKRDYAGRMLGLDGPVKSVGGLSMGQASQLLNAMRTGEIPAPAGPNANGEGISEFDVLDQMILDVHDQQSQIDTEDAIGAELNRGTITESDAELLRERLAGHVERAKAGASA